MITADFYINVTSRSTTEGFLASQRTETQNFGTKQKMMNGNKQNSYHELIFNELCRYWQLASIEQKAKFIEFIQREKVFNFYEGAADKAFLQSKRDKAKLFGDKNYKGPLF
jgi:hypothetical protein